MYQAVNIFNSAVKVNIRTKVLMGFSWLVPRGHERNYSFSLFCTDFIFQHLRLLTFMIKAR